MAPPVQREPVVAGCAGGEAGREQAGGLALVGDDGARRAAARRGPGRPPRRSSAPVGRSGRSAGWRAAPSAGAPTASASASRAATASSAAAGQDVDLAAVGHQVAGLARVGEERHRRLGVDQDQVGQPVELHGRELGQVAEALDGGQAGTPLEAGGERLGQQLGPGGGGHPADAAVRPRCAQRPSRRRSSAARLARAQHGRRRPRWWRRPPRCRPAGGRAGAEPVAGLEPRHVGGQDQRGHLAGRPVRRRPRPRRRRRPRSSEARPTCAASPTRCGPPSRCRSRAGRRTACGRWRGRRRC